MRSGLIKKNRKHPVSGNYKTIIFISFEQENVFLANLVGNHDQIFIFPW